MFCEIINKNIFTISHLVFVGNVKPIRQLNVNKKHKIMSI